MRVNVDMFEGLKRVISQWKIRRRIKRYEGKYRKDQPYSDRPESIHVEETFDDFVTEFGGHKISELIVDKAKMPSNADYIFEKFNVIAELKTLEGVFSGPNAVKQITQALSDAGCSYSDTMGYLFRGEGIPEAADKLVRKRIRRSIEQRIYKARKQLKKSKKDFGNSDTRCIILIAMDSPPIFGHRFMLFHIAKIMEDNYADEFTDGIVYFNPNMPTKADPDGMEFSGWYPVYRDENVNHELSEFINLLGSEWLTFYGNKIGETNPILTFESAEGLMSILR